MQNVTVMVPLPLLDMNQFLDWGDCRTSHVGTTAVDASMGQGTRKGLVLAKQSIYVSAQAAVSFHLGGWSS